MWWPDYDRWPERTYAYVRAHLGDMQMTIDACRDRKIVIQAGGHVGLWPLALAEHFAEVWTFEPDQPLYDCLVRNIGGRMLGISVSPLALGDHVGKVSLTRTEKAGSASIGTHGVMVRITTIDQVVRQAEQIRQAPVSVSAIVLDIEGGEVAALRGAAKTIERHRPVIHVEQLKGERTASHEYLQSIGYRRAATAGRDALYLPGEA